MYDQPTWSDFEYQEQHGHLPDKGMTSDQLYEMFGDTDPQEVKEILALRSTQSYRAVHDRLTHHFSREHDPCQDRGVRWPCDVADAFGYHEDNPNALPALPCGCVPHRTRVTNWSAMYCDTEEQPYCNFECPHDD